MDRQAIITQKIKSKGLLPLFYHADAQTCIAVTRSLFEAGVPAVEFTNRGEKALENFKKIVAEREKKFKGLLLGVGTIKTTGDATQFIEAGADFLVSPMFDSSIYDVTYLSKSFWIPGCMTPTEIHRAHQAGCDLIKLFPGNVLGPGFLSSIRPLFPGIEYIVTGGVDKSKKNLREWFDAGAGAVGMGSYLISRTILEEKKFESLKEETKKILEKIKGTRA